MSNKSSKQSNTNNVNSTSQIQQFLSSKKLSDWFYIFSKNPAKIGLNLNDLITTAEGYESDAADGYLLGNEEILGAVGCPCLVAEEVYAYYSREELTSKDHNEDINLLNYPSRMTVLVGPKKESDLLRVLFTEVRYQDFVLFYKINGTERVKPLWRMPNRLHYRIEKTRIAVAELFDDEINVKIVDFALKVKGKNDLPVLSRIVIIENLTDNKIDNLDVSIFLGNFGRDWNVIYEKNKSSYLISSNKNFNFSDKNHLFWGLVPSGPTLKNHSSGSFELIKLEDAEDFEELNELFDKSDANIMKYISELSSEGKLSEDGNSILYNRVGNALIRFNIGELNPRESNSVSYEIIPSKTYEGFNATLDKLEEFNLKLKESDNISASKNPLHCFNPLMMLKETFNEWVSWFDEVPIEVSNSKIFGIIDSNLTMLRCLMDKKAIHIGALYYPHNSAFWRDNYWLQNAFLKAGRHEYASIDTKFFFEAWKNDGFRNSYGISTKSGSISNSKEMRVEVPLYSALMVKNLYRWLHDEQLIKDYYAMMKDAIDESISSPNNLCVLLSDETWIWPAYVNEHDFYIDNSLVGLSAYEFGLIASKILKNNEDHKNWMIRRDRFLKGIEDNLLLTEQFRFATGIDNNNMQDESILPTLISRPLNLNLDTLLNPMVMNNMKISSRHAIYNGLGLAWETMSPTGVIRSHSRTSAIEGNTPGHYLYACSDLDVPYLNDVLQMVMKFPNATGALNEIHDMYNRKWGTGKQRSWDSSTLMEGILHYLFGIVPNYDYFDVNPHLPPNTHSSKISNQRIHEYEIIVSCHKHGENFEKSVFMKELNRTDLPDDFPIPEIQIIRTNLQGRVRIYDGIIKENKEKDTKNMLGNYFATKLEIYPRFIDTNTQTEFTPMFEIKSLWENDSISWKAQFSREHLDNLEVGTYSLELPAHKIVINIQVLLNRDGTKHIYIKSINHSKLNLSIEIINYIDLQGNIESKSEGTIEIDFSKKSMEITHTHKHLFHKHSHSHEQPHSHDHQHPHEHPHSHDHLHSHDKELFEYPFKNIYDHQLSSKIYWKPHPLVLELDNLLFTRNNNGNNLTIICDLESKSHAYEIYTSIAITKQLFINIICVDGKDEENTTQELNEKLKNELSQGKTVIITSKIELEDIDHEELFQKVHESKSLKPSSFFSIFQKIGIDYNQQYVFYVKNNRHCYNDTHKLCQALNTYLVPQREKSISMFPHGIMRLADVIGEKIDDTLPIRLKIKSDEQFNVYIQGIKVDNTKTDFSLDTKMSVKTFKPEKPYFSIFGTNNFTLLEAAAVKLSEGKHSIKFDIDSECEIESEVILEMILPQNFQTITLAGDMRERTLDPTEIIKKSDGSKILRFTLHPGKEVHKTLKRRDISPKARKAQYILGKFPKLPK